jgi:hypothetical protein
VEAPFSNTGPVPNTTRIKPEVVAPGLPIFTTMGRAIEPGRGPTPADGDTAWCWISGTSFSAPLVTGAAAVLRQVLRTVYNVPKPPAALLKALLVNGAAPLDPATDKPSDVWGFGRVNLQASIDILKTSPKAWDWTQTVDGKGPGRDKTYDLVVPPAEKVALTGHEIPRRLRATLVWTDIDSARLVDVLFLTVVRVLPPPPDGSSGPAPVPELRYGNKGSATDRPDFFNNTQRVDWVGIKEGDYRIVVSREVSNSGGKAPTKFAVVWSLS